MSYTVDGRELETDEQGYLLEADYSEEVVPVIAAAENLTLSDAHWKVIHYLRDEYREHGHRGSPECNAAPWPERPIELPHGAGVGVGNAPEVDQNLPALGLCRHRGERPQQPGHLGRPLLLHPVARTLDQMHRLHPPARLALHPREVAGALVDAPVA